MLFQKKRKGCRAIFIPLDIVRIFHAVIFAAGVVIVYFGVKAYAKTKSLSLLFLAIGFLFVTIGSSLAGFLFEIMNYNLVNAEAFETGFATIGFFIIIYSLFRKY